MGKHKHSKDKLYIVQSEYASEWGGFKTKPLQLPYKALPFFCCGLSLRPFEEAVCTSDGIVFDPANILPYIKRYRRNPVTGKPLSAGDLVPLHFHKNAEGEYHCPITYKVFNRHTHIVANRKTGHVYSHDAIENLCKKPKSWKDLLTGQPFSYTDIIHIQNPADAKTRCIESFYHVREGQASDSPPVAAVGVPAEKDSMKPTVKKTEWMDRILAEVGEKEGEKKATHNKLIPNMHATEAEEKKEGETKNGEKGGEGDTEERKKKSGEKDTSPLKHSLYTTHRMAAGFTSTVVQGSTKQEYRVLTERERMQPIYDRCRKLKKKGYVRLVTTHGSLNLELHADMAPRTCDSFLRHCASKYYEDTIFHRCIKNFMIQGGRAELRQPSKKNLGVKKSSVSCSGFSDGKPFEDEFDNRLTHEGIGIVSMANNGTKHANLSEFFITFKSCTHLNNKHTIFGRVVGGLDTLRQWEKLETDKSDKPLSPPKIEEIIVFKNPFEDAKKEMEEEKAKEEDKTRKKIEEASKPWFNNRDALDETASHPNRYSNAVGRYLPPSISTAVASSSTSSRASKALTDKKEEAKKKKRSASDRDDEEESQGMAQPMPPNSSSSSSTSSSASFSSLREKCKNNPALLEYASIPQKVKIARTSFDFSSW